MEQRLWSSCGRGNFKRSTSDVFWLPFWTPSIYFELLFYVRTWSKWYFLCCISPSIPLTFSFALVFDDFLPCPAGYLCNGFGMPVSYDLCPAGYLCFVFLYKMMVIKIIYYCKPGSSVDPPPCDAGTIISIPFHPPFLFPLPYIIIISL